MKKLIIYCSFLIGTTYSFAQTTVQSNKKTQEPIQNNSVEEIEKPDTLATVHSTQRTMSIKKVPLQKQEEVKQEQPIIINNTSKKPK